MKITPFFLTLRLQIIKPVCRQGDFPVFRQQLFFCLLSCNQITTLFRYFLQPDAFLKFAEIENTDHLFFVIISSDSKYCFISRFYRPCIRIRNKDFSLCLIFSSLSRLAKICPCTLLSSSVFAASCQFMAPR